MQPLIFGKEQLKDRDFTRGALRVKWGEKDTRKLVDMLRAKSLFFNNIEAAFPKRGRDNIINKIHRLGWSKPADRPKVLNVAEKQTG